MRPWIRSDGYMVRLGMKEKGEMMSLYSIILYYNLKKIKE